LYFLFSLSFSSVSFSSVLSTLNILLSHSLSLSSAQGHSHFNFQVLFSKKTFKFFWSLIIVFMSIWFLYKKFENSDSYLWEVREAKENPEKLALDTYYIKSGLLYKVTKHNRVGISFQIDSLKLLETEKVILSEFRDFVRCSEFANLKTRQKELKEVTSRGYYRSSKTKINFEPTEAEKLAYTNKKKEVEDLEKTYSNSPGQVFDSLSPRSQSATLAEKRLSIDSNLKTALQKSEENTYLEALSQSLKVAERKMSSSSVPVSNNQTPSTSNIAQKHNPTPIPLDKFDNSNTSAPDQSSLSSTSSSAAFYNPIQSSGNNPNPMTFSSSQSSDPSHSQALTFNPTNQGALPNFAFPNMPNFQGYFPQMIPGQTYFPSNQYPQGYPNTNTQQMPIPYSISSLNPQIVSQAPLPFSSGPGNESIPRVSQSEEKVSSLIGRVILPSVSINEILGLNIDYALTGDDLSTFIQIADALAIDPRQIRNEYYDSAARRFRSDKVQGLIISAIKGINQIGPNPDYTLIKVDMKSNLTENQKLSIKTIAIKLQNDLRELKRRGPHISAAFPDLLYGLRVKFIEAGYKSRYQTFVSESILPVALQFPGSGPMIPNKDDVEVLKVYHEFQEALSLRLSQGSAGRNIGITNQSLSWSLVDKKTPTKAQLDEAAKAVPNQAGGKMSQKTSQYKAVK